MDVGDLGAHRTPAALGLDAAHGRQHVRPQVAHAVAVGHLEEAVGGGHRADPDRLEEDGIARICRHRGFLGCGTPSGGHLLLFFVSVPLS
ncbi:hypothetical protein D9M68_992900 [compost metagenome]